MLQVHMECIQCFAVRYRSHSNVQTVLQMQSTECKVNFQETQAPKEHNRDALVNAAFSIARRSKVYYMSFPHEKCMLKLDQSTCTFKVRLDRLCASASLVELC
jgi:hypothetical protein